MADKPLLFTAPMVQAILDGRKTMTRRLVKPQPELKPFHHKGNEWWAEKSEPANLGWTKHKCPIQPGDRVWVRETIWAKNDTCDHEYCSGCDVGSMLDLGAEYAEVQYVATPECHKLPELKANQKISPYKEEPTHGYWWLSPPDGWDGDSDFTDCGEWVFIPTRYFTKHPSIHMPRWASRITLPIVEVRVERLQDISEEDAYYEGIDTEGDIYEEFSRLSTASGFPASRCTFRYLWECIHGPGSWDANPFVYVYRWDAAEVRG